MEVLHPEKKAVTNPVLTELDEILPAFLAFARSKPAGEGYSYCLIDECAFAQFLKARHPNEKVRAGPDEFAVGKKQYDLPELIDNAVSVHSEPDDRTFGALADRLEALA